MRALLYIFCCFSFLGASRAADSYGDLLAGERALEWLAVIDAERYNEAWGQCSDGLQADISAVEWSEGLAKVRGQLGIPIARKMAKLVPTDYLPDAPNGDYMVVSFESEFAGRSESTNEIVVLEKAVVFTSELQEALQGKWVVAAYYIN